VFIKASPEAWYYFGLEDNRLLVQSSNSEFNSIISKKTNGGKAKIGEVAFIPGSDDETLTFINRFRKDYYEIDVPYDLNESAAPARTEVPGEEVQRIPEQTTPQTTPPVTETAPAQKKDTPKETPKKEKKKRGANQKKDDAVEETPPTEDQPKKDEEVEDDGF
jgi:hypothetical protein